MKKLLLLLWGVLCCVGFNANAADVVESLASYTAAKNTWLPTAFSDQESSVTSTNTGLTWKIQNVEALNIGSNVICMTFKKQVNAYAATTPAIACNKIILDVRTAGTAGGMDFYANEVKFDHKDITGASTVEIDVPAEYQSATTEFKIVNTHKADATGNNPGNQIAIQSITFKEATTPPAPTTVGDLSVKLNGEDYDVNDAGILLLGDTFTFSAENAGYMYIVNDTQEELTVNNGVATWTPPAPGEYDTYVYAMLAKGNAQGVKEQELYFEVDAMGDLIGKFGEDRNVVAGTSYVLSERTSFSFSAERADKMTVERVGFGEMKSENGSTISFIPVEGLNTYKVTATRNWTDGTIYTDNIQFSVNMAASPIGDIVIKRGDEVLDPANDDDVKLLLGETLTFYCPNADHIFYSETPGYGTFISETVDGSSMEYKVSSLMLQNPLSVTVYAYQGDNQDGEDANMKSRTFQFTSTDPNPLGEVSVMINGEPYVEARDEDNEVVYVDVAWGSVVTYACENAETYTVNCYDMGLYLPDLPVDGSFKLEKSGKYGITITARKIDYPYVVSEKRIFVRVGEKPQMDEKWMLVTSASELEDGGEYLICAASSAKAMGPHNTNGNNRTVVDVTIVDNEVTMLPEDIQIVKFVSSTDVAGAYNLNVGDNNYLYVPSTNSDKNNNQLKMKEGTSELSAATFTMNEDGSFQVEYTKAHNEKAGRFMHYNLNSGGNPMFNCYTEIKTDKNYEQIRLFKKVETIAMPAVPVYDEIVEDYEKVSVVAPKGELHVWVETYNAEGELAEGVTALPAEWNNKVKDEGEAYEIAVPETPGSYLMIYAKAQLNGFYSDVLELKVKAYKPTAPIFDRIEDDNTIVSFMTPRGDLHIYTTEYDKDMKVVNETSTDVAENAPMYAAAQNWTNKVADEEEVYTIAVPATEGHIMKIQAKAVLNNFHSEEVVKTVDSSGTVIAGVDTVLYDGSNAPVEYYNLQGVRVDGTQPGLYLRRQGNTVEKVIVK